MSTQDPDRGEARSWLQRLMRRPVTDEDDLTGWADDPAPDRDAPQRADATRAMPLGPERAAGSPQHGLADDPGDVRRAAPAGTAQAGSAGRQEQPPAPADSESQAQSSFAGDTWAGSGLRPDPYDVRADRPGTAAAAFGAGKGTNPTTDPTSHPAGVPAQVPPGGTRGDGSATDGGPVRADEQRDGGDNRAYVPEELDDDATRPVRTPAREPDDEERSEDTRLFGRDASGITEYPPAPQDDEPPLGAWSTGGLGGAEGVRALERERYAGLKIVPGLFGWLAATGIAVLLTQVAVQIAAGVRGGTVIGIPDVTTTSLAAVRSVSWHGMIVPLVIILLAYFGGGYVAGRMARFAGIRQGLVCWLWGAVIAVAIAVAANTAGQRYDILGALANFPRIPIGTHATHWGLISLIVLAAVALVAALLGGLTGMGYHRRVDTFGLRHLEQE